MNTWRNMTIAVTGIVLCVSASAALADDHEQHDRNSDQDRQAHSEYSSNNYNNAENNSQDHYRGAHRQRNRRHRQDSADRTDNNNWDWDQHNWNDQRSKLRADWRDKRDHLSAEQQQKIDNDMKAQWNQYHHNKWRGQYSWEQYNDPRFLDYVRSKNPSLLTNIRSLFGY